MLSNTLFSMICHHSISSIVSPVKPTSGIKTAIRYGFLISIILSVLIPFTGMLAFGNNLVSD